MEERSSSAPGVAAVGDVLAQRGSTLALMCVFLSQVLPRRPAPG